MNVLVASLNNRNSSKICLCIFKAKRALSDSRNVRKPYDKRARRPRGEAWSPREETRRQGKHGLGQSKRRNPQDERPGRRAPDSKGAKRVDGRLLFQRCARSGGGRVARHRGVCGDDLEFREQFRTAGTRRGRRGRIEAAPIANETTGDCHCARPKVPAHSYPRYSTGLKRSFFFLLIF